MGDPVCGLTVKLIFWYFFQLFCCTISSFHWTLASQDNVVVVPCVGPKVLQFETSSVAATIYLGTVRPLLPNACFQPSLRTPLLLRIWTKDLKCGIDSNQDENCRATSKSFIDSGVQKIDVMNVKLGDATSYHRTTRFWMTLCIWVQFPWNKGVKRTEHSCCMLFITYCVKWFHPYTRNINDFFCVFKERHVLKRKFSAVSYWSNLQTSRSNIIWPFQNLQTKISVLEIEWVFQIHDE